MSSLVPEWPIGGGELGALIRAFDWSQTSLGPMADWPQSLKTATDIVLQSSVPLVTLWGEDGIMIYNDAYSVFAGGRHPQLLGSRVREGWIEVADFNDNVMRVGLAGGTLAYQDQELTLYRNGRPEQVWMNLDYSPVLDEQGRPAGVLAIVVETTERVRVERAIHVERDRSQGILDSMGECFVLLDRDFRVVRINAEALRFECRAASEVVGRTYWEAWPGTEQSEIGVAYQRALREGVSMEMEHRFRLPDGREAWVEVRAYPWDGGLALFYRDIGERIRIEEALRASEGQSRAAAEALAVVNATLEQRVAERTADRDRMWRLSTDIMLVAGFDGAIMAVNPAWTMILGWEEADLIGGSLLDLVHPEDRDATLRELGTLSEGTTTFRFENRYRKKDGGYLMLSWTAVPDAQFIHAVGRDMTAEREAAEALRQTEAALNQAQKMEAVGQLTGGVAHDFNNLLTVIRSSVDLLKRPNLTEERRQRYVEAISDTTMRAAKLTGQLLAFARRQALKPEIFDVVQTLTSICDMVASLTGSRIRIETEMPEVPCFVNADPSQFDTALVNLAVNARDAMNGEGRLTIALRSATTIPGRHLHPEKRGDFVAVSVTDTGEGIAPDRIDKIFEPFFTTKDVGKGTGLGLSQVIGFVKQSGGDVAVESRPGVGSTFTLYLPRSEAKPREKAALGPDRPVDGQGTRVLVVEDNDAVGAFASQTLSELGYEPVLAANAGAALAELATDAARFDVVFSDVVMPGMNGIELGQEIRRRHADLPVILTSGYSHVLAENGTYGFELLQKPYSIEQLSRVLRKAAVWRKRKRGLDET